MNALAEGSTDRHDLQVAERIACIRDACPLCALGHDVVYAWELRDRRPHLGAWAGLGHRATTLEPCRAARIWVRHAADARPALGVSAGSFEAAVTALQFQEHERRLGRTHHAVAFPVPARA